MRSGLSLPPIPTSPDAPPSPATSPPNSRREQAGAGLDRLTAEEFGRFTVLNTAYREKFGIPFIFAVRGADKFAILAAFEARIGNAADVEFATALQQVCRIVAFRLEDRVVA